MLTESIVGCVGCAMLSRREAIKLAIAGALSPLLSLLPEREDRNVWWEVVGNPYLRFIDGYWYDSHGCVRLWMEGVSGYVLCRSLPEWLKPEILAETWQGWDGKVPFIRIYSTDHKGCYDFYCEPKLWDEPIERGSLNDSTWRQGPLPVQKEAR